MTTITGKAFVFSIGEELHDFKLEEIIASGLSYEEFKHTKTLDYLISKGSLSVEDALKFNANAPSLSAFINGASVEDSLKFEHWSQFSAYDAGASIDDSLTFIVNNTDSRGLSYAIDAIKLGATIDQAFGFVNNYISSEALRKGAATPEQALEFTSYEQLYALQHEIPVEMALRVTDHCQIHYLLERKDMSIEEASEACLEFQGLLIEPGTDLLNEML